ncbi:MAG: hypothetical protein MI861_26685, partial [Pirellulales bacterium]|nr:hypothetical protein [Pirellulales bacterium]
MSIGLNGNDANLGAASPAVSGDGSVVAFASISSNLVVGDTNNTTDIFVYDRPTDTIERVSLTPTGQQSVGNSGAPQVSSDGQLVAFLSDANDLVPSDQNNVADVFVHDRSTGTTERVSIGVGGVEPDRAISSFSMSSDGRFISFVTDADNLVPADNNGLFDTFVFDRSLRIIERVSISSGGVQANGNSLSSSISGDGRYVAFASQASNLVFGDNNSQSDVFLYDRQTDTIDRISDTIFGDANAASSAPQISNDGRFVVYQSDASNLILGDTNAASDIFRYDRLLDRVERITEFDSGAEANLASFAASISSDGRFVSFESLADNLVAGDINRSFDVFLHDTQADQFESLTLINPVTSTIFVSQVTTARTVDSDFAITGRVDLNDVLLTNNSSVNQLSFTVTVSPTVIAPQVSVVGPLTQIGDLPPVHPLIQSDVGNVAIDAGDPTLAGTTDQLGTLRTLPDIGSFEAATGFVGGNVFVDLNQNQRFDPDEPGLADVAINAKTPSSVRRVISSGDASETSVIDETGKFEFEDLDPGLVQFEVELPPQFSFSKPEIRRVVPQSIVPNSVSAFSALSANGRFVAFDSAAANLAPGDFNGSSDIFVYDSLLDSIQRVSFSTIPAEANGNSG